MNFYLFKLWTVVIGVASSTISIKKDNKEIIDASIGEGTIDAIFKTTWLELSGL